MAGPDFDLASHDQRSRPIATCAWRHGRDRQTLPRLIGPGECGGPDMVELEAVLMPGQKPRRDQARRRCCAARWRSRSPSWVRDEARPRVAKLGSALTPIENYDAFECRGRNRVFGAKLSEHGKGNAIDLRALDFADGRRIELTDVTADKPLREDLRDSACHRFTTVLGPGADRYHEGHIHLDIEARRAGYRICQWDVREPPPPMPLPRPRPALADAR